MPPIEQNIATVQQQIIDAESHFGREPHSVQLLAVSKTRSADEIKHAQQAGLSAFGESYLQEALEKIDQLQQEAIEWHFIGRIQSNKTKLIAEHFDWVHSIDNLKHAQRLNSQRPDQLAPLKVCLQVNVSNEESKGGFSPASMPAVIAAFDAFPRLALSGLMAIPAPAEGLDAQRLPFQRLYQLREQLADKRWPLRTLSMGMSADLEAAIAEGSTIVRVGTAIFGARDYAARAS
ncbi:MAG: YggS family pyridoxal phosphate-dependent enzyme [Candidatus Polarisedimenticolaceae bacterium]|nr:YggS family pyridoxal phosphate-dependent enzyme [Candidatus Polarisedimenticolaceae bacterium]